MAWVAAGAGLLFGIALVMLATFFATKDERFDRIAEWSFVGFAVLAVVTMLAIPARLPHDGFIVGAVTAIGVAGALAVGLGELGTTLKLLDFRKIAPIVTIGFIAFLAWIGGTSLLVLGGGTLPVALGWLGLVAILVGVAIVVVLVRQPGVMSGEVEPSRPMTMAFFVPMAAIVVWLIWLGTDL